MKIFTAHWKHYTDDVYADYNRKMFINESDANKFLDDLINHDGIHDYYIKEETVFDQYSPMDYEITSDWECSLGTLHGHDDVCNCDEYIDDYPCDIINEF